MPIQRLKQAEGNYLWLEERNLLTSGSPLERIYGGWGNFGAAAAQFTLPAIAVATTFLSNGTVNWRLAILLTGIVLPGLKQISRPNKA